MPVSLFINTTGCGWTPAGGSLKALNRISSSGLSFGGEQINNRADVDIYDSSAHIVGWKPTVTFAGMNVGVYTALVTGLGAIAWTWPNADDVGTTGGAGSISWTMSPAMNLLGDSSNPHGAYASGNLSFNGLAADGITNPLAYTILMSHVFASKRAQAGTAFPGGVPAGRSTGLAFRPRAARGDAPAPGTPVDAVFMPMGAFASGRDQIRDCCTAQVAAARILGVDPDQVWARTQGTVRVYTPAPTITLLHAKGSEFEGDHRLDWHDRGDGLLLGYLTARAREEDLDADAA
jgi:hypothetical protein